MTMSTPTGDLFGFAYGEDLEGVPPRSLGYRLLAPARPQPWCAEVEALARRLQAAPYPDHWPATDLFCSVLLADGRRVVALARYGLSDHTPSQRRGGLELVGVVAPPGLDVRSALSVYVWLRRLREQTDDLHRLGSVHALAEVLASSAPPEPAADPLPVLPVRLWQEGALLFAASSPADPDHRLRLLEQAAGASWQWLPLVGPDFPLHTYAQRGPLIAWTPHLAGVALKLDRKSPDAAPAPESRRTHRSPVLLGSLVLLGILVVGNLWALLDLRRQVSVAAAARTETPTRPEPTAPSSGRYAAPADDNGRLLKGLEALVDPNGVREWQEERAALLDRYERLARTNADLRVPADDVKGKLTVAAVSVLAERSADRVEETVRRALSDKGFSDRLIKAACEHVHEQLVAEVKDRR
jgi:hypothetical protein